jgi:hypothetical protein
VRTGQDDRVIKAEQFFPIFNFPGIDQKPKTTQPSRTINNKYILSKAHEISAADWRQNYKNILG